MNKELKAKIEIYHELNRRIDNLKTQIEKDPNAHEREVEIMQVWVFMLCDIADEIHELRIQEARKPIWKKLFRM